MKDLYPHQIETLERIRGSMKKGNKRVCLCMPTGSGKTVLACHIAMMARAKGKKLLFVVHQKVLVVQAVRQLSEHGLNVGIIQGENTSYTANDDVVVASIQSIKTRSAPDWIDMVIIDETHIMYTAHLELLNAWPDVPVLGMSATPMRVGLSSVYTDLVQGPSVRWLTDNEFLVPVKAYRPSDDSGIDNHLKSISKGLTSVGYDYNQKQLSKIMRKPKIVAGVVRIWRSLGQDRQTLCFSVDKAHSKSLCEEFELYDIAAAHVEDRTTDKERRRIFKEFEEGRIRVICSVGVISVGFDQPSASCLILARPTLSRMLDMQQKGRGIRSFPGKKDCIILDYVGNITEHGLPVHFQVDNLEDGEVKHADTKKKKKIKTYACENCGYVMDYKERVCEECGTERTGKSPHVEYVDGTLVEYGTGESPGSLREEDKHKDIYRQLIWYASSKGYKEAWAYFRFKAYFKNKVEPSKSWKSLGPKPASKDLQQWILRQNRRYFGYQRRQGKLA